MPEFNKDLLTGEKPNSHRDQTILMALFFIVWITDSFLLRLTTFLSGPVPFLLHLAIGFVILVVGFYFMRGSHKDLFETYSEGLTDHGVYARVRHPMYLSTVLSYIGFAVITLSIISLLICIIILVFYNGLANYEERLLQDRFGDDFVSYKSRVRKWIPL